MKANSKNSRGKYMLKNCPDCQQQYSVRAQQCLHCGAPNDDLVPSQRITEQEEDSNNWGFIIGLLIFAFLMFFYGEETRNYVLNFFNAGVVAEVDLKDCDSDRVKNEIKDTFDKSPYALNTHLKAILVETQQLQTNNGAILTCLSTMTLNNNQTIKYSFDFKKHGDNYLIEGQPW